MSGAADIDALRFVLERDPASPLFYELAAALIEAGRWEEAETVLRAGVRLHPRHLEAHVLLGLALARLGRREDARQALEAVAHTLKGLAGRVYPQLSDLCEEARETGTALEWLRLAEAHGPLRAEEAERRERLAAKLGEERRQQVLAAARELMDAGQPEEAAGLITEALREAPEDGALREGLEEASSQVARAREAQQVIGVLQGWLHNIREIKE